MLCVKSKPQGAIWASPILIRLIQSALMSTAVGPTNSGPLYIQL